MPAVVYVAVNTPIHTQLKQECCYVQKYTVSVDCWSHAKMLM